jgi:hypothetical protein
VKVNLITDPFNYIVIDDFYSEEELKLVMEEITALEPYALDASFTGSAIANNKNEKKDFLKSGRGIFLDEFFVQNRSVSKILNASRKLFSDELREIFNMFDPSFRHIGNSDKDTTLINYYKNGEEYSSHKDKSTISAVTFLNVGNFEGGNFCFPEFKETILFKHNRIVIFNGCMNHQAEKIIAEDGSYRASIAQFIGYK